MKVLKGSVSGVLSLSAVFAALGLSALVGCGKDGQPTSSNSKAPSAQFVQSLQNPSGCLDVMKLSKLILAAKNSHDATIDFAIVPDGTPVSEAFLHSVIHNTPSIENPEKEENKIKDLNVEQKGCESLTLLSKNDGEDSPAAKIITATPTKLVLEKQGIGDDPENSQSYFQISFELTGNNELRTTGSISYTTPHGCKVSEKGQEYHQVLMTSTAVWGDNVSRPEPTFDLARILAKDKDRAATYKEGEKTYCAEINK